MKIVLYVIVGVLVIVGALLVVASFRPDDFHVERSTGIAAPSSTVFRQLDDFHAWPGWSPWAKLDPQMQSYYDGPTSGVGASYRWAGNSNVGEGSMRIIESIPDTKLVIQLEFLKPFKASNRATFMLLPEGGGTKVTWSMDGRNALVSKVMGLFMDMDKMIGADFERGLSALKQVSEADARSSGAIAP